MVYGTVPVGILLSGGVDSSLISSFVSENNYSNIKFYTLADHETDLIYAREVANCLNIPLKEVSLNLTDEKYAVRGYTFGLNPPKYLVENFKSYGAPRTIGITIGYSI